MLLHISRYSLGNLLTAVAGLVSFPFLARVFSVADYGLMNLVSVTLTALVTISKLGLQHSVVRYGSRVRTGTIQPDEKAFVSTAVLGIAATAALVALGWLVVVPLIPMAWLVGVRLRMLFGLVSILVFFQAVESALINLLRAQQRSGLYATYQVVAKYAGLGLIIASLLLVGRELLVFYSAQIVTAIAGVAFLCVALFRDGAGLPRPALGNFSAPIYKEMLRYGFPMMLGWELSGLMLSLGDRYVLQVLLGPGPLGTYAAAYNLCQYVEVVLLTPWAAAIMPMYVRLWEEGGEAPAGASSNGHFGTTHWLGYRLLRVYAPLARSC